MTRAQWNVVRANSRPLKALADRGGDAAEDALAKGTVCDRECFTEARLVVPSRCPIVARLMKTLCKMPLRETVCR